LHLIATELTGININAQAHIGPGVRIPHGGYIVIGPGARIGRNCDIFQGVTLGEGVGTAGEGDSQEGASKYALPTLGDRVWVGPGAVIAGEVTVGDDASVGANSLLVRDVPSRGVVLGVPARLVSRRGSFAQIFYREMDNDDRRTAALAEDTEAAAPAGDASHSLGQGHPPARGT
jgi:serine O-acetyltransferase